MNNPKPPMRISYRIASRELGTLARHLDDTARDTGDRSVDRLARRARAQARKMLDHARCHAGEPLRLECQDAYERGYYNAPTITPEQRRQIVEGLKK